MDPPKSEEAAEDATTELNAVVDAAVLVPDPEITPTVNGEPVGNKRKLEDDTEETDESARKRTSFSGPHIAEGDAQQTDTIHDATQPDLTATLDVVEDQKPEQKVGVFSAGPVVGPTGELEDVISIPSSMVGRLIGRSGETVKHLQNSTGTRVQIDHQVPGETKKVTISGSSAEAVTAAKQQIEQIISEEGTPGDVKRSINCPPGIVGRIIGRGGETIRALQQASQAHIVVDQNFPEGEDRKVNLSGRADAVERASKMVEELITGEPGSAQAIIQKVKHKAVVRREIHMQKTEKGRKDKLRVEIIYGAGISKMLDCPKAVVGRVIGKQGETIKALQKNFGANIQIDQTQDPMKITIAGQPQAVEMAAGAVQEIINGGHPYLGGPGGASAGGGYGGGGQGSYGGGNFAAPGAYGAMAAYGGGFPAAYGQGYGGFPGGFPGAYGQAAFGGFGGYGQDAYGGGGGGYGGGGGGGGGGLWQELQDDQGRTYYYNTQTGSSQWEKPDGY